MKLLIIALICLSAVICHPTYYKSPQNGCESYPTIYSYHIHMLFLQNNELEVQNTLQIRQEFMDHFDVYNTCDDSAWNTTYPPGICMFEVEAIPSQYTPFPVGEWAVFVPISNFSDTVRWTMQHRSDFSILVHPNSGCEVEDHRDWTVWGGLAWELDLSILGYNCPGCTGQNCKNMGLDYMYSGDYKRCGLEISQLADENGHHHFVLHDQREFCSPECQNWVYDLQIMDISCPYICKHIFSGSKSVADLCYTHVFSIQELVYDGIKYC